MSRRSCLSISALIRFDSFASSLRQQAIMDSRVIPSSFGSPVKTGPRHTVSAYPESAIFASISGVGLSGWTDGWDWGEGILAKGPRCQVVPPSKCDFTRVFSANHGRFGQGEGVRRRWGLPEMLYLNTANVKITAAD